MPPLGETPNGLEEGETPTPLTFCQHPALQGTAAGGMTPPVAAKPKTSSNGNFFAIVGTDEGQVREQALRLHQQLTGGNDDGFTHETIDGDRKSTRLNSSH